VGSSGMRTFLREGPFVVVWTQGVGLLFFCPVLCISNILLAGREGKVSQSLRMSVGALFIDKRPSSHPKTHMAVLWFIF